MSDSKRITRREFSSHAALAFLGGVVVTLDGCGDNSYTGPSGATTTTGATNNLGAASPGDVSGVVSANHGHIAVITAARLMAGGDVTLDIEGTAGHPHSVVLAAGEVQQIANGAQVTKQSSLLVADERLYSDTMTHSHSVTFN